MRMIGIALLGFLLAGTALLVSSLDLWERGTRDLGERASGPGLVFETRAATEADAAHRATILRSTPDHPVILAGLPAYQGVAFTLPVDARPTSGYLQIDATFQVLDGVEGVLRISIDNTRRGEMLLRPGEGGRSLRIPLSPTDIARDRLVVSFQLQGQGPHRRCGSEDGVEAIVEIETTSAVFLTLDRPLSSARDRIAAWGQVAPVAWPHWLTPEERLRRLVLAADLLRRGVSVRFDAQPDDALDTAALRDMLSNLPMPTTDAAPWPRGLTEASVNAGLRRFHGATSWRLRYDLRTGVDRRRPDRLDLDLRLGQQIVGGGWQIAVTLNGRLLHQTLLPRRTEAHAVSIDLPADLQRAVNTLEITAASTYEPLGECGRGPELMAELGAGTVLHAGAERFDDDLTAVQDTLIRKDRVSIGGAAMFGPVDARSAADLLARVVPAGIAMKPGFDHADLQVIAAGEVPTGHGRLLQAEGQGEVRVTEAGVSDVPLYPGLWIAEEARLARTDR